MRVQQIMTSPALGVTPDTSIATALRLMLDNRVSGLVVLDAQGALVGVVTEGDFLRRSELGSEKRRSWWRDILASPARKAADYVHDHGRRVADVMTGKVISIAPDTTLEVVANLMLEHGVKRLPVVDDGRVVGIVSRANLLKVVAAALPGTEPGTADDRAIETAIAAELERQTWISARYITARAQAGAVVLTGTVFNDEERKAARVVAENVPGVRSVADQLLWVEPISGTVIPPAN
ncbi:CBS domain-containing protein [Zavarzinia sp. CC-PAN008]|uniref:CBS domain-containing protein n=1 Tax=Zavarzinia sp. CC-PAN008 TaxID=3243332 RepID=UPI003F749495